MRFQEGVATMSLRILIVDDSPAMRAHMKKILNSSGLPIEMLGEAGDGVQGLAQLREKQFNLIFSDLNMPNMNGDDFVREIKADKVFREIPVIMVTTDNSTERVMKMGQMGCDGYICKPFNAAIVKEKVLAVMGG
jgi:two-component system chemotaxis response regulator CheY